MGFWKREDGLERELRVQRPEPRRELVDGIASRIVGERRQRGGRGLRVGVAVALSAGMLGALGAFGGLSYAANGVTHAVSAAVHAVVPAQASAPSVSFSSAMAQYKVEMCFHSHTLSVDSHAVNVLKRAGATEGPCSGSAFRSAEKLVRACFEHNNITIAKLAETGKTLKVRQLKLLKLHKLGITIGFCKKV